MPHLLTVLFQDSCSFQTPATTLATSPLHSSGNAWTPLVILALEQHKTAMDARLPDASIRSASGLQRDGCQELHTSRGCSLGRGEVLCT